MGRRQLPKDAFFRKLEAIGLSITYNDIRLKSGYSKVMPRDISLETKFSRNVGLNMPLTSAAMDTVTEADMALELARLGGIGVIHKNLTIIDQTAAVARVKYHLHGKIDNPRYAQSKESVADMLRRKNDKKFSFDSFPVLDEDKNLVGIVTGDDVDFCEDHSQLVSAIMQKDVIYAPPHISMNEAFALMKKHRVKCIPLVDKSKKLVGMYARKDIKRIRSQKSAMYNLDSKGRLRVAAAVGVDDYERAERLVEKEVDVLVLDSAHADTYLMIRTLKKLKKMFPKKDVVMGNISEPESAKRLLDAGADGIKIGQGPGSICTTREETGIGCPQATAVYNCAKVADRYNVPVCADGGIVKKGDIPVAIGCGAHSVMLGNLFAGHDESPGEKIEIDGRPAKVYRGMGSIEAMRDNAGSRERYSQGRKEYIAEGVSGAVPYRGPLRETVKQLLGGLRNGMGYVGAASIKELRDKADFRWHSGAAQRESMPHDLLMTSVPPSLTKN